MTAPPIKTRDFDYVEARLLGPAPDVSDAITRLRDMGQDDLADRTLDALRALTEECRYVRRVLTDRFNNERYNGGA